MDRSNAKKRKVLGENPSGARARLLKSILFKFIKELRYDTCFRCGVIIETIDELSIEHKIAWLNSDEPRKLFYDLNNIAFSHMACNCGAAEQVKENMPDWHGEKGPTSKITNEQAIKIRRELKDGATLRSTGLKYGLHHRRILDIKKNKTYI